MTAKGKNVKIQTLATENEIFVYDRRFLSDKNTSDVPLVEAPEPWHVDNPPDTLRSQNDLEAWKALFMARRSWTIDLAHRCIPMHKSISDLTSQINIINRGVSVALENLKIHVEIMETRMQETRAWASDVVREQRSTIANWSVSLDQLKRIPAPKAFSFVGHQQSVKDGRAGCLADFLDVSRIQGAGSQLPAICDQFQRDVARIEEVLMGVIRDTEDLVESIQSPPLPHADELYKDVETITRQIESDYGYILQLSNNPRALSNVSKVAFNQTSILLPSLMMLSRELYDMHKDVIKRRNGVLPAAVMNMQKISQIQSQLAGVQAKLNNLDVAGDIFDTVYEVFELPAIYGAMLIEAVRRREWTEQMNKEVEGITADLSRFKDEESKRRKEWMSSMGTFISAPIGEVPEVTFTVQDNRDWPVVSRNDVESYIHELESYNGLDAAIGRLSQLYRDLDAPVLKKRDSARLTELNQSTKESHSDRSLKDEKAALEEKLKSSETRVRRLENLLHQQSERSRPNSAQIESFMLPPQLQSRQSQAASLRRPSMNHISESTALAQRIATIEAELSSEKEITARLQKELSERSERDAAEIDALKRLVGSLKTDLANEKSTVADLQAAATAERQANEERIQEADSIKKDLMGNIQAQQREFEHERKHLEEEIKTLTMKLEEVEDHLDARDTEKIEFELNIGMLKEQLAGVQRDYEEVTASAKVRGDDVDELIREKESTLQTLLECLRGWYAMLAPDMEPLDEENIGESFSAAVEFAVSQKKDLSDDAADLHHQAWEVSHRLYSLIEHLCQMLEQLGFVVVRETDDGPTFVQRQKHKDAEENGSVLASKGKELPENNVIVVPSISNRELVEWAITQEKGHGDELYRSFLATVDDFPISSFTGVISKRMKDIEAVGRKWRKNARNYREQYHRAQNDSHNKIAYRDFKNGDLALFLPTRNEPLKSWAAFNVGAPHRFLRASDPRQLATRDWLVARITKVEEHVVDQSRSKQKDDLHIDSIDVMTR
ncbi:oligomeric, coiled-coil, peripheral membrane protein, partial [Ascosphaera pollenicola]